MQQFVPAPPIYGKTMQEDVPLPTSLLVFPWEDERMERHGYDPRSEYVERFWLGTIGPSATLLLRRVARGFDEQPRGFRLYLAETAGALGLGAGEGKNAPIRRTCARLVQFGLARWQCPETLEVRRFVPPLALRYVARLPAPVQRSHERWVADQLQSTAPTGAMIS